MKQFLSSGSFSLLNARLGAMAWTVECSWPTQSSNDAELSCAIRQIGPDEVAHQLSGKAYLCCSYYCEGLHPRWQSPDPREDIMRQDVD